MAAAPQPLIVPPQERAGRLVAHRGYPLHYPENSIAGLRAAVDCGARYVECDVQLCADGTPVLLHERSLLRTTGIDLDVCTLSFSRLAQIDCTGASKLPGPAAGLSAPRLSTCVELLHTAPEVTAFVEIKPDSLHHHGVLTVVNAVLATLGDAAGRCVVISFSEPALRLARQRGARSIGWILSGWDDEHLSAAHRLAPDFVFCRIAELPPALPSAPWDWVVYETSDPSTASTLFERGADLVETDAIAEMLQAFADPTFRPAQT